MRRIVLFALAGSLLVGCASSGTNADRAGEMADMEKRVNAQALKDNPPPPGEGPSN